MNITFESPFSLGKYLVSPMCRRTDVGDYVALTSIRSGSGPGTHDRVYQFRPRFQTVVSALTYATQEGRALVAQRSAPTHSYPFTQFTQ